MIRKSMLNKNLVTDRLHSSWIDRKNHTKRHVFTDRLQVAIHCLAKKDQGYPDRDNQEDRDPPAPSSFHFSH